MGVVMGEEGGMRVVMGEDPFTRDNYNNITELTLNRNVNVWVIWPHYQS